MKTAWTTEQDNRKLYRRCILSVPMYLSFAAAGKSASAKSLQETVNSKFRSDGSAKEFSGSTIIIPIIITSPAGLIMTKLYNYISQSPIKSRLALLPPNSWHMTIFEVVNDHERKAEDWPIELKIDATLMQVSKWSVERLQNRQFPYKLPIVMKADDVNVSSLGVSLHVTGFDEAELRGLHLLRDSIADVLEIHRHNHETYRFHMTLAYTTGKVDEKLFGETRDRLKDIIRLELDKPEALPLGAPVFCTYENMLAFTPRLTLLPQTSVAPAG